MSEEDTIVVPTPEEAIVTAGATPEEIEIIEETGTPE